MIRATNVTKTYKYYKEPLDRLKELLFRKHYHREFVALKDITLNVGEGETIGLIGENGAGKTTLLKIFAGVLKPTYGEVKAEGRVASLLELGAGFHPEFSGIENIYFYGSLLGLSKNEITGKIDEIIDFSELGDYINMPVRTYSSGMFLRLAFSVAITVDPDILIIDEVLSVGDLHFQKKSTGRILELKKKGKSILFCSHSMYHINLLCDRVVWLMNGSIEKIGKPFDVTSSFESYQRSKDDEILKEDRKHLPSTLPIYVENIDILNGKEIESGQTLKIKISVKTIENSEYGLAVSLRRNDNIVIHTVGSFYDNIEAFKGDKEIILEYPDIPLLSGSYYFVVYLMDSNLVNIYQDKISPKFRVLKDSLEPGLCNLKHNWIC